jgi:hypothetical protein
MDSGFVPKSGKHSSQLGPVGRNEIGNPRKVVEADVRSLVIPKSSVSPAVVADEPCLLCELHSLHRTQPDDTTLSRQSRRPLPHACHTGTIEIMVSEDEPDRLSDPLFYLPQSRLKARSLGYVAAHKNAVGPRVRHTVAETRDFGLTEEIQVDVSDPCKLHLVPLVSQLGCEARGPLARADFVSSRLFSTTCPSLALRLSGDLRSRSTRSPAVSIAPMVASPPARLGPSEEATPLGTSCPLTRRVACPADTAPIGNAVGHLAFPPPYRGPRSPLPFITAPRSGPSAETTSAARQGPMTGADPCRVPRRCAPGAAGRIAARR